MNNDSIWFLHQMNDGGLLFLNEYLETKCECSVFHISPSNRLVYNGNDMERARELKEMLQDLQYEGAYHYHKDTSCMLYDFRVNDYRNRFVFYPVKERECKFIFDEINAIYLPMSYFLKGLYYSFGRFKSLMDNDTDRIFSNDREYWKNYLAAKQMDPEEEIAVVIIQPMQQQDKLDRVFRMMQSFSLRYTGMDILNYIYNGRIIQVVPSRYKPMTSAEVQAVNRAKYPVYRLPELLNEEFGGEYIISIGSKEKNKNMYDSYLQALASLYYCEFFRKEKNVVHYKSIGPASRLIQSDLSQTESYLEEKYESLNKYESDRNGFLLTTLRELVRCQFNYQDAAQRLHIHLNTLYYRQEKLSGIIGADLTELETKIIVYEEMFAYDFIKHFLREEAGRTGI